MLIIRNQLFGSKFPKSLSQISSHTTIADRRRRLAIAVARDRPPPQPSPETHCRQRYVVDLFWPPPPSPETHCRRRPAVDLLNRC
ncbi:hypothetical protein Q3G72_003940 [Acer saccharum]|nr:hypothetical protein Q3G72_003940 [Acer saccharum]